MNALMDVIIGWVREMSARQFDLFAGNPAHIVRYRGSRFESKTHATPRQAASLCLYSIPCVTPASLCVCRSRLLLQLRLYIVSCLSHTLI